MDNNTNDNYQGQTISADISSPTTMPQSTAPTAESEEIDASVFENMSNEEFLKTFAKGLLVEKDLGEMDEETEAEMVQDLVERMTAFVNRAVLEALPEDKLDAVGQIADNGGSIEEVNKIVQEAGVNTDQIIPDALEKFRSIYLSANENSEA